MNQEQELLLKDYLFPVEVYDGVYTYDIVHAGEEQEVLKTVDGYKSIIRVDTNEVVSIVKNTYQLTPNKDIIDQFLGEVDKYDNKWEIEPNHSYVNNKRMRLDILFKDKYLDDSNGNSTRIYMGLSLQNSYDQSCGKRIILCGLREICTNGSVFWGKGKMLYAKHIGNGSMFHLATGFKKILENIPILQERITHLKRVFNTSVLIESIEKKLSKSILSLSLQNLLSESEIKKVVEDHESNIVNQWHLYNTLTYYVTHQITDARLRGPYQESISRIFQL